MKHTIILSGSIPSKKNSRVNLPDGRSFPNQNYYRWERAALKEFYSQKWTKFTEYPVRMNVKIYVKDNVGRDIDNMLSSILDVIKDARYKKEVVREGIVTDDSWRYLNPIHVEVVGVDKTNPRAEIELWNNPYL